MKLDLYQIDAFADQPFTGNPAAVCPLDEWLDDSVMQAIAEENNLAETAFFIPQGGDYAIRWFTPTVEVELCGHATLASAYVLFNELGLESESVAFHSRSGLLEVTKQGELLVMNFPSQGPKTCDVPKGLPEALGTQVIECFYNEDYVAVLENEQKVEQLMPDFEKLAQIDCRGIIVTSLSNEYDFVARFFGPRIGLNEDSVTGSAFTKLIPLWADKLGKNIMNAKQVSARGGEVNCELAGDRVNIGGNAIKYMQAVIEV